MTIGDQIETRGFKVKLRAGASFVRVRPIFVDDSKNIILASGCDVKVFSIESGECLHTLRHHKSNVIGLQENKSNHLQFFSCSDDGVVVRWDHTEGKQLQVHELGIPVAGFYACTANTSFYVIKKLENPDHFRLYIADCKKKKRVRFQLIANPVSPNENCAAFGFQGRFVASVYENILKVYEFETKAYRKHYTGERKLTCVACHPSDYVVATGDNQGRVIVWTNFMHSNNPVRSVFHWHSLPVADVAFSPEGSYLYSGGGEAALLKWNLFCDEKFIIPRLGAPICKLAVSTDNSHVMVSQDDNCLQVVNSQMNVVQIIQGLTQGHFHGAKKQDLLPTGLIYDSRSKALVMNGKPGHLQFYNVHEDKQLFNLDIGGRNLISQERESAVMNTDIQRAAIDDLGRWLATAEYWHDEETSPQIWLKFWEFDESKQNFILNTNVILPHNKEINCIVFRPSVELNYSPFAVTTSADKRFKTWILKDDECFEDKKSWNCVSMGCYRDLPPGAACFCEDGSLLAVAFTNIATLWTVDGTILKAILSYEKAVLDIKQLVFGRQSFSHLLVCHDGSSIIVWNVLTLSIKWILHVKVQMLVADTLSEIIAAFFEDKTLILFKPNHPKPMCSVESVTDKPVVSAIFVPKKTAQKTEDNTKLINKSTLFFFNENQNLLELTDDIKDSTDEVDVNIILKQNIPPTPFGKLQPELKVSGVEVLSEDQQSLTLDTSSVSKVCIA